MVRGLPAALIVFERPWRVATTRFTAGACIATLYGVATTERFAAVACEPFRCNPCGLTFKRTLHPQGDPSGRREVSGFRLTVARRRRIVSLSLRAHRSQRTVFPSTKSAVNVICGTAPQGWGEREKQQVTQSRTKSSREAARGRASPLSGEPGTRVRAIRADRWRPEGQRASNGRRASRGSDRHTRRPDSIHG